MASSTGLAVFDALAADVHRRMGTVATAGLPDAACEALIATANEAGGQDNISVVVLRVDPAVPSGSA